MQTLNFCEAPSKVLLIGKMAAFVKPGMTDKEFLECEIKKWLHSPERLKQLQGEAYYDGEQEILHRKRMAIGENAGGTVGGVL